jgi:uncharacterized SAM-binding protein YcdF (DUF218 family)
LNLRFLIFLFLLSAFPISVFQMKRRKILKILLALFVVLIALGVFAWFFPQQVLTVDSGPVKADVLVVLGGRPDRAGRAAELFKEGAAPKILVTGFGDNASNKRQLEQNGVPTADIIVETKSRTTRQNAEFSIPLLRQMGAHKAIVVTSWYHSRRALMCFEHYGAGIKFYSRPSYAGYVGGNENAEIGKAENRKQPGEVACWNKEQIPQAKQTSRAKSGQQTGEDGGSAPHPASGHLLPIGCGEGNRGGEGASSAEGGTQGAGGLRQIRISEAAWLLGAVWGVPLVVEGFAPWSNGCNSTG